MGFLDDALNKLSSAMGGANQAGGNPLVHNVLNLINDPKTGGVQGLVKTFHDKGLGGIVNSWVGTGSNQPISADQITHALGADRLQQIAQASGTSVTNVASQLTALLPSVIDKLTPQGTIPQGSALAEGLAMLKNTLGAAGASGTPNTPSIPQTRSPK